MMTNEEKREIAYQIANAETPPEMAEILRIVAQKLQDEAAELAAAWQDEEAGAIWTTTAEHLERAADAMDDSWNEL